jgi:hypothetical protein
MFEQAVSCWTRAVRRLVPLRRQRRGSHLSAVEGRSKRFVFSEQDARGLSKTPAHYLHRTTQFKQANKATQWQRQPGSSILKPDVALR